MLHYNRWNAMEGSKLVEAMFMSEEIDDMNWEQEWEAKEMLWDVDTRAPRLELEYFCMSEGNLGPNRWCFESFDMWVPHCTACGGPVETYDED